MEENKLLEINEANWDKWASSMDSNGMRYKYLRKCQRGVISLLDLKENLTVLDIGCGTGWALGQIAKMVNSNGSFYGVDISTQMIERAKEKFADNKQFHFVKSNAESIPFDNDLFNIIICSNSFHHYLNPNKALEEMYRLLKIGGKAFILDPTADSLIMKIIDNLTNIFDHSHVKLYSSKEFEKLILDSGLSYFGCKKIEMHQKVHIGDKIYF